LPHDQFWTLAGTDRGGEVVLYAGSEPAHLYRSVDYGETWQELTGLLAVPGQGHWMFPPPPHVPHVKNLAFDPVDADTLYVGIEQGALLKSTDGGRAWRELDAYYSPDDVYYKDVHRLVVSPSDPRRVYMAGGDGLYASEDGGETWEHLSPPTGLVGYPDALLLAPDDDRLLFMAGGSAAPPEWRRSGSANAGVVRSHDGGRTWSARSAGCPRRSAPMSRRWRSSRGPAGSASSSAPPMATCSAATTAAPRGRLSRCACRPCRRAATIAICPSGAPTTRSRPR
jgi:hypothetical protein